MSEEMSEQTEMADKNNSASLHKELSQTSKLPGYLTDRPEMSVTLAVAEEEWNSVATNDRDQVEVEAGIHKLNISGVGFDSLPEQLVRKHILKGFTFNIMCMGETGVGKSTLMDCLFSTNFESIPNHHYLPAVSVKANSFELQEGNVTLKLTICETAGYGDQLNREDDCTRILEYVDSQYEAYLQEELKIMRDLSTYHDTRVHVCVFFICPSGHGLKPLDLDCMKQLGPKVNIIPIIAKADAISSTELQKFKDQIKGEIERNEVQIYHFPTDDESYSEINTSMNAHIPFAVISSTDFFPVKNKNVRARQYPWGIVEVENETHCEFVKLREMLIRTNMQDLIERTHSIYYEEYRKNRLTQMGFSGVDFDDGSMTFEDTIKHVHKRNLQQLQEREWKMHQSFVRKVNEKEMELKKVDDEVHAKFEKMQKELQEKLMLMNEKEKKLQDDIQEFNKLKLQFKNQSVISRLTMRRNKK